MGTLQPIPVAQYGIGPIGAEIARLILTKPWAKLVAAVDIDPHKIGNDLGEVIGLGEKVGVRVTKSLDVQPLVVCHSTGSRLREVEGQIRELLDRGCHVVSTCEELAFPLDREVRERLQQSARGKNVTLLGTGVNPGFVMDKLALTLTSVCQQISRVDIIRVVDASLRREPLQRKVGAGLTREQFEAAVKAGKIKHMGLKESLMMVADGLNIELDDVSSEEILPVMAESEITTQYLKVVRGQVAGVHQQIHGSKKGRIEITLDIKMFVGAKDPRDQILIKGVPDVNARIEGGVHGDRATAAMVVNAIPRVVAARPGVLTMDDIPISFR
jgi:4-hydroxy-tetrahydrodipicolinate reductase